MQSRIKAPLRVIGATITLSVVIATGATSARADDTGAPPTPPTAVTSVAPATPELTSSQALDVRDSLNTAVARVDASGAGANRRVSVDAAERTATLDTEAGAVKLVAPANTDTEGTSVGRTTVFAGAAADTTVAIQPTATGVRAAIVIDSADTPESYPFQIGGAVASLHLLSDGSAIAFDSDGSPIAQVDTPWAVDAFGVSVPTHYEINGTVLTQVVDQHSGNYGYPIVADPLTHHWWGWDLSISQSGVTKVQKALNLGLGAAGLASTLAAAGVITSPGAIPSAVTLALITFGKVALDACDWNNRGVQFILPIMGPPYCLPL